MFAIQQPVIQHAPHRSTNKTITRNRNPPAAATVKMTSFVTIKFRTKVFLTCLHCEAVKDVFQQYSPEPP
jgi:hypothetical protein